MNGERITRANLDERAANVNRRLAGTGRYVEVQGRNGYVALDEYAVTVLTDGRPRPNQCVRNITVGTTREVGDFLHAMMVGIDLSRIAS